MTTGLPFVIVPVLSSATTCMRAVSSSAADVLKRMPFFAPSPLPTMMATGVASPSAQGQETTSTEMARLSAKPNSLPTNSHIMNVSTAAAITDGTKTALTLSATLAIGAFVAAASPTILIICESVVSLPTRVARTVRKPLSFIVAALTRSPALLSTGMLSPVSADSFTAEVPSVTMPSTAKLCPGRTVKKSPTRTSSAGMVTSLPSRSTVAVLGVSSIRLLSASVVCPLLMDSSSLPRVISVTIIAALS